MKALFCSRCGEPLRQEGDVYVCDYCGATYKDDSIDRIQETLRSFIEKEKIERLANRRRLLWEAVHEKYPSKEKVVFAARAVLEMLPEDFLAGVYLHSYDRDPFTLNKMLSSSAVSVSEAAEVFRWLLPSLSARTIGSLHDFVDRHFENEERKALINDLEAEADKVYAGLYEPSLHREVFLCYSSADMPKVIQTMDLLEQNGFSCFAAFRNLRHGKGAQEDYLSSIFKAMRSCEVFVFISTEASRSVTCDALRVELPYLIENLTEKPRIEFLLEDYDNTPYLAKNTLKKAFFSKEYCQYEEDLLERISSYINHPKKPEDKRKIALPNTSSDRQENSARKSKESKEKKKERSVKEKARLEAERKRVEEEKRQLAIENEKKEAEQKRQRFHENLLAKIEESKTPYLGKSGFVYFGRYPQAMVSDRELLEKLAHVSAAHNKKPVRIEFEGEEYVAKGGHFYLVEPIAWKPIFFTPDNQALLLSKFVLDRKEMCGVNKAAFSDFEFSALKAWLNGPFAEEAFGESLSVVREDIFCGIGYFQGVTLLSYENLIDPLLGFAEENDESRSAAATAFASGGDGGDAVSCYYWTKTRTGDQDDIMRVVSFTGAFRSKYAQVLGGLRPCVVARIDGEKAEVLKKKFHPIWSQMTWAQKALFRKKSAEEFAEAFRDPIIRSINGKTIVLYGKYPQTKVTNETQIDYLRNHPDPNENGYYECDGLEFVERAGSFYLVQPIEWIVLGESAREKGVWRLLSKKCLDFQPSLGTTEKEVSSDYSDRPIQDWLNRGFVKEAFSTKNCLVPADFASSDDPSQKNRNDWASLPSAERDFIQEGKEFAKAEITEYAAISGSHDYWVTSQYDDSRVTVVECETGHCKEPDSQPSFVANLVRPVIEIKCEIAVGD